MICDGCGLDRTVTVTERDYLRRITTRCRACGGAVDSGDVARVGGVTQQKQKQKQKEGK